MGQEQAGEAELVGQEGEILPERAQRSATVGFQFQPAPQQERVLDFLARLQGIAHGRPDGQPVFNQPEAGRRDDEHDENAAEKDGREPAIRPEGHKG